MEPCVEAKGTNCPRSVTRHGKTSEKGQRGNQRSPSEQLLPLVRAPQVVERSLSLGPSSTLLCPCTLGERTRHYRIVHRYVLLRSCPRGRKPLKVHCKDAFSPLSLSAPPAPFQLKQWSRRVFLSFSDVPTQNRRVDFAPLQPLFSFASSPPSPSSSPQPRELSRVCMCVYQQGERSLSEESVLFLSPCS